MQLRYIPSIVVLLAAAITSIINIMNHIELYTGLKRLLFVIIIFYIIGLIARTLLMKVITPKPRKQITEEEQESPQTEEVSN